VYELFGPSTSSSHYSQATSKNDGEYMVCFTCIHLLVHCVFYAIVCSHNRKDKCENKCSEDNSAKFRTITQLFETP
jgi:hypothetical protein